MQLTQFIVGDPIGLYFMMSGLLRNREHEFDYLAKWFGVSNVMSQQISLGYNELYVFMLIVLFLDFSKKTYRKKEASEGREWERRFFSRVKSLPVFERLVKEVSGGSLEADQTGGIWSFDQEKAKEAKPPFSKLSEELKDGFK